MKSYLLNEEVDLSPYALQSTQEWFADIITNPLGENDTIQAQTPHGYLIAEEAARYIVPSPTLRPDARIQIYNQQYWWRLLNALHVNFPLVTRLFGYHAFNAQIGIPYLIKYPPNHWSLATLGERMEKWVFECYHEPDQKLIGNAVGLDWAFTAAFIKPEYPSLDLPSLLQDNPESILSHTFYLQPHMHLFKWDYDLFSFRQEFLDQEVEYWVENRFPELSKGKTYYFVLYRNAKNNISWREIGEGEYLFMGRFKTGSSITEACEYIEAQEAAVYEEVSNKLQQWLQEWTHAGWFTLTTEQQQE